ncbi:OsmC family peroxiredoxin [Patulibacter sp. SYSU D01012]|uniref:OsmC family peroxiredoxin n=1 Tax=Patulibacter sp. SYSU D01012 TaxID=2817381 RepID=UPI001B31509C|nr:OsmC family peroxiredoxin [Patulibacter sp. SYSU D01012]
MPVAFRKASTEWQGTAAEGGGTLTLVSSGAGGPFPVSLTKRTDEADRTQTNPEELIAAAHSSCYAMAFSNVLTQHDTPPSQLDVDVRVTLDKAGEGFAITRSEITVTGDVPGLDQATFERLAGEAEKGCPVSNALRGSVEIALKATLA